MEFNAMEKKRTIITKMHAINMFLRDNQEHIEPTKMSELISELEKLEEKVKQAFSEDEQLDKIMESLKQEIERQNSLIKEREQSIAMMREDESQAEKKGSILDEI